MKAAVVPDEVGVGAVAPREGEARPGGDGLLLGAVLIAIGWVDLDSLNLFGLVRAHAMVQDDVGKHLDTCLLERPYGGQVLLLGTILGGNATFLVKLSEVVGVVDAVSHIILTSLALVGGREPDTGDADGRKGLGVLA